MAASSGLLRPGSQRPVEDLGLSAKCRGVLEWRLLRILSDLLTPANLAGEGYRILRDGCTLRLVGIQWRQIRRRLFRGIFLGSVFLEG